MEYGVRNVQVNKKSMYSITTRAGFAEINFKSFLGFKLFGRDKNAVKTKMTSKITQLHRESPLL